ncbi:MAG: MarR family transcriptional regulator [Proteobacteria bacterium]|nr:MarR family transcriptional regulator [Pseudomonadota bacterium]
MADIKPPHHPLFLREEELRYSIELMFFVYRDFTGEADAVLAQYGLGRAHHRVIYFVGRLPGTNVTDLLGILNITKQALGRVLSQLVEEGYIDQSQGTEDKRQRLLHLTAKGKQLEENLTLLQKRRFAAAFKEAGSEAVTGWLAVMERVLDADTMAFLHATHLKRKRSL